MAVRAQCDGILDCVRSAMCKQTDMMNLKVRTEDGLKWSRALAQIAEALGTRENPRTYFGISFELRNDLLYLPGGITTIWAHRNVYIMVAPGNMNASGLLGGMEPP